MLEIIGIVVIGILTLTIIILGIIIRGMLIKSDEDHDVIPQNLSGREIETLRRQLVAIGSLALSYHDILNLIKTINSIQLGNYEDLDPYIPADPYEDV